MQIQKILTFLDELSIEYQFDGDSTYSIESAHTVEKASSSQFCYLSQVKLAKKIATSNAGLIITQSSFKEYLPSTIKNFLWVKNPHFVFAKLMQLFYFEPATEIDHDQSAQVTSNSAMDGVTIEENVVIKPSVIIGHNSKVFAGTVIDDSVIIGKNCRIGYNVVIHKDCVIGDDVIIESGSVIGGDGFGWAFENNCWHKIPQIGRVIIGSRVSIGNNVCIDRGAIEDTIIEDDVIIDNQVHIAHNVTIGHGSAIAAQAGFAGSMQLGAYNLVAGQVGFAGHIQTADQCQFHAKSGVTNSIQESGIYAGFPAYNARRWQRNTVKAQKLDELHKDLKAMKLTISALEQRLEKYNK